MSDGIGRLAYATANDRFGYIQDAANFRRLLEFDSGVKNVDVCIAVSEVTPRTRQDERWYRMLADRLEKSGRFRIVDVIFKSNLGRDFSSWEACLGRFKATALPNDIILMINRSAFGPMMSNWYSLYAEPFAKHPSLALCGSSINFDFRIHVQSYAWMSRISILDGLLHELPGSKARSKVEAIFLGEIGMSQFVLERGYSVTSLAWPNELFDAKRQDEPLFPHGNQSDELDGIPFRHWGTKDREQAMYHVRTHIQRLVSKLAL